MCLVGQSILSVITEAKGFLWCLCAILLPPCTCRPVFLLFQGSFLLYMNMVKIQTNSHLLCRINRSTDFYTLYKSHCQKKKDLSHHLIKLMALTFWFYKESLNLLLTPELQRPLCWFSHYFLTNWEVCVNGWP